MALESREVTCVHRPILWVDVVAGLRSADLESVRWIGTIRLNAVPLLSSSLINPTFAPGSSLPRLDASLEFRAGEEQRGGVTSRGGRELCTSASGSSLLPSFVDSRFTSSWIHPEPQFGLEFWVGWITGSRRHFARALGTRRALSLYILDQDTIIGRVLLKRDGNPLGHVLLHRPVNVSDCPLAGGDRCRRLGPARSWGYRLRICFHDGIVNRTRKYGSPAQEVDAAGRTVCCGDVEQSDVAYRLI